MNVNLTSRKIVALTVTCIFVASLVWMSLNTYLVIRQERVCTQVTVRLNGSDNEVFVTLPSGHFQIHFTAQPRIGPSRIIQPHPVLPAHITTSLTRSDGSAVFEPRSEEYFTFAIGERDAFRRLTLRVSSVRTQEGQIYMNLASGF